MALSDCVTTCLIIAAYVEAPVSPRGSFVALVDHFSGVVNDMPWNYSSYQ
jgi:hypothetical protein